MKQIEAYLSYITHIKKYSISTVDAYRCDIMQFLNFAESQYDCRDIALCSHLMIRAWIVHMHKEGAASPRSINRKLSSLNGYFKFLIKENIITLNPMKKVTAPKVSKKLPNYIVKEEMVQLVDHPQLDPDPFKMSRNTLIINLLYQTGMRRTELINLRDEDINWSRMEIRVVGKGKKQRIIPITEFLISEISKYRDVRNHKFGICPSPVLIVSDRGVKMNPKSLYNIVKSYLSLVSSSDKKSPHVLRHTFATHLLNNGADLNAIKEILGHANLSATQVYTHNSVERLIEVYKQAHPKADK